MSAYHQQPDEKVLKIRRPQNRADAGYYPPWIRDVNGNANPFAERKLFVLVKVKYHSIRICGNDAEQCDLSHNSRKSLKIAFQKCDGFVDAQLWRFRKS